MLMDIYGKVYIRVIRAQFIFITNICFCDYFYNYFILILYLKERSGKIILVDKEPDEFPDL